jgi:glutaminyl-tRNA synthetase
VDAPSNFLRDRVAADVAAGTYGGRVATRFPPEPNGYPHLGHAKTICLNFGIAEDFGGTCTLRYDDTNPETESAEYAAALEDAVRWLGFAPSEVRYTSDYFEQLHAWAVQLIEKGLAFVDSESEEQIRARRGTVTQAGEASPFRDRSVEENLRLFDEMRRGEHADGTLVLRAKIETEHGPMAHPNMKLRDPLMYRIRRDAHHYRRGDAWPIYPFYDWAHGQSDAIEGITHSVCTLEFDVNRPLYDWFLDALGVPEPRNHQHEFARFNLDYTVMSKRKLLRLVNEGHVAGWDDPRMPTIAGQRRRGIRPEALRRFCDETGVSTVDGRVDVAFYDHIVRDDLNALAPRLLAVATPLRLTIDNLDAPLDLDAPLWPHDVTPPAGMPVSRPLTLGRDLWIERDDFSETPQKGWKRLAPGAEVRLRHGPVVRCTGVDRDDAGEIVGVRASVDLTTLGAEGFRGGVIHWADAATAVPATFRLYDRLFTVPVPEAAEDVASVLNPVSLVETRGFVEPAAVTMGEGVAGGRMQFERLGFFWPDPVDSTPESPVFNRIVALRDSWGKKAVPVATPTRKSEPAPVAAAGPRDPASALSAGQRTAFEAFAARGVGAEESAVLAADAGLAGLFEATVEAGASVRDAAILLVQDVRPLLAGRPASEAQASPEALAALLALAADGTVTRAGARTALAALVAEGGQARETIERLGLASVRDDAALVPAVEAVMAEHPDKVAAVRAGEAKLVGFLTGQAMRRAPKGADPKRVQELLRERLGMT